MEQKWIGKTNKEGKVYIHEQNLTMKDFYENCLSLNNYMNNDKPFNKIYSKPSLRSNKSECDFYINLSGTSQPCNNEIENIDDNNKNFTRYIKKINNLPINIFNENLKIKFYIDEGGGRPPEGGGAGGTGSDYGWVHVGDVISKEAALLRICAMNKLNNDWVNLGSIDISVSIVVDSVDKSSGGAQSFTVKLANLNVNYENAKWADENDNTHGIDCNIDDLYYTMWLDFDGQNSGDHGISFSANTDANNWNVSKEIDDIYINKDNNIEDNYKLADHAISKIEITVSLDDSWEPV